MLRIATNANYVTKTANFIIKKITKTFSSEEQAKNKYFLHGRGCCMITV